MNRRGQATTEMVFIFPLLLAVIGAFMFLLYGAWQGIKTQQAANLAARIQGQERVQGGTGLPEIDRENGNAVGQGDTLSMDSSDSTDSSRPKAHGNINQPSRTSVYGRYYFLIKEQLFPKNAQVIIPAPVIGQNIDKVSVFRLIDVPNIPFIKPGTLPKQIQLQGTAWGGEDTYMYALPRWGQTGSGGSGAPEWNNLTKELPAGQHD